LLVGVLNGDNVSLNANAAKGAFADKYVAVGKTVNVSGLTIVGTNAANYSLIQPSAVASISAANLTITAKGVNKVYDSTTSATVSLADNRISGDVVTDSYASAAFTNKTVGSAKLVVVTGLSLSGTDAINYLLTSTNTTVTANVTVAGLTVSGITASNKVYDARTTAGLVLTNAALVGVLGGDVVSLVKTNAKGLFANKTIGAAKSVTVSGLTVTGADAINYTLTQPSTTASITAANLTVTAKGVNKVYSGTTVATVTLSDNRLSGDVLTDAYASAAFSNSVVGAGKIISVTGIAISGTD
jgi:maltooligosyltrehalose synthase